MFNIRHYVLFGLTLAVLAGCTPLRGTESRAVATSAAPERPPKFLFPTPYASGTVPDISLVGIPPGEQVRIVFVRMFEKWEPAASGQWEPVPTPVISWADMDADQEGKLNVSTYPVETGTWTGPDPYALFWSGRRFSDPGAISTLPDGFDPMTLKPGENRLIATHLDVTLLSTSIEFGEPNGLSVRDVSEGWINGVYAVPDDGQTHPALILLHGSEGGSLQSAREMATRFAGKGYAAFALNYFSWDMNGLTDIPDVHVNQPVELIADVRNWLSSQPGADVGALGLYGHSKGAEYAEVAAVRYPWIKAVAACVPTDVVWEGYGIGDPRAERSKDMPIPDQISSWSWQGEPLPYIPLRRFVPDEYFDNTERYELSRQDDPRAAQAAVIPIERAEAEFLLLGSDRDEVWASGAMARNLAARMGKAGRSDDVRLRVFSQAGHQICGDGTYPTHLWSEPSDDPRRKDLDAEGRAAAESWQAIVAFFEDTLKQADPD